MTLPADYGFRSTRYSHGEVLSLLIERSHRTGVSVEEASPEQGRRLVVRYQRDGHDERRTAVVLGRSSDWYKYRLNVYAQFEGVQWVIAGTHDSCLSVPVWSVEEERLYEAYQTCIPLHVLMDEKKLLHTSFGHKLLLGAKLCGLPEADMIAANLKRSAQFDLLIEVRQHTHRKRGRQLKIAPSIASA